MTILLQRLVQYAWVFYAACAVGVIIYVVRALAAQRERNLALFTLERETATARILQSWVMVFVFVAIGAVILASTKLILPGLSIFGPETRLPTPTLSAGVEHPSSGITPSPSPTFRSLTLTATLTATSVPASTSPPPELTETLTPAPTDAPEITMSGEVHVRFGDFAELVGYSLPSAEVAVGQPLLLTLYWRGMEGTSATNYLVFSHLLSEEDGHLVAQHDGAPASGTRPTTSWVTGETIADPHPMAFQDTTYTGPAKISVGLYDPTTGRVLTETGGESVVLPITIIVIPQ